MTEGFDRGLLDILPFGIGYIKLLLDEYDEVIDYRYIDVNPAFEQFVGMRREEIANRKLSGLSDDRDGSILRTLVKNVSAFHMGKPHETTQWMQAIGRYCKIMVVPKDQDTFALVIRNAAETQDALFIEKNDPTPDALWNVFDNTHDAVSLVAYSGGVFRYVRNNAVHKRQTGLRGVGGKTAQELYGQEVGGELTEHFRKCMETGRPVLFEYTFDFEPGRRIWQIDITPVFGEGKILCLLCVSKDVTQLRAAEKERDTLARRLTSTFEQHSAVMLVIHPQTGRIMDANPAACAFYGYTKGELLALNIDRINMQDTESIRRSYAMARDKEQNYFLFPHRLKSGEIRMVDVFSCPIDDGGEQLLSSIIFDATEREKFREELFCEKELLRITLQSIGDGVVSTDNNGIITGLNGVAQELTGWDHASALGRSFPEVFILRNEETGRPVENPIQKVLDTGRIVGLANHTELVNRQGRRTPIADSAAPIKMEDGETFGVVMVFRDVSLEKEQSSRIRFLSYHDSLTGLHNRRYMEEAILLADSEAMLPLSIIMGDVNGLKITNDVFGHEAGDSLLRHVVRLLEKYCRKDDIIARWGGDEFVVLLPRTSLVEAEKIVQNIKRDDIAVDESGLKLSISLGCAVRETTGRSVQAVLRESEGNMYQQKLLDGKSYRNAIINTLLATLYEKSMETESHSKRMEAHCHSIGRRLKLSYKELDELSLLAVLHDIGKVAIDPDILKKPGKLTSEEWVEMKRHPEIGYRIVQATPELANVADFILSHHERWDGAGYPRGLRGREIPLLCRILAVTDAYDAMTNDREYRKAMSCEDAILELERNAGTQFDPDIVSLFIHILQENTALVQ